MAYANLMVHLALGRANEGPLRIAADLAARFGARVIGLAACQPVQVAYADGCISGEIFAQDRDELDKEIEVAEREFRVAMASRAIEVRWRSAATLASLAEYSACEARIADLIIIAATHGNVFDASRAVDPAELVVRSGRPLLVIPPGVTELSIRHVLIGWKDTREARRAVADALPLLAVATRVTVVEMAHDSESVASRARLDEVIGWLRSHSIDARALLRSSAAGEANQLNTIATEEDVDLIVAGAYGHSRMREWMLGGVTRELLNAADRCVMVSH